ncbi:uncharacterized protein [Euphorbia lathyris]|uniref:uncharacterized protein isoform X2 n=1 Tax=Euphorbia lathyris TaxID=212925 RepID=UPI0033130B97
MQGGRGGRGDPFFGGFGDPFGGFGDSFGGFGGIGGGFGGIGGGFANHRSLMSNFFGGRDPFDNPFFTRPFGGGMFESHFFGSNGSPFASMRPSFIENQPPEPKKLSGPIIEELSSDDENEEAEKNKKENPRKHGRSSKEPYVEDPDDEAEERKRKLVQHRGSHNRFSGMEQQPQTRSFCFQSSTVSYGGTDGTYYTSSKTRRTGSDGLTFEESKEADSSTRQASHRISRGLHNKGHTLTRKLESDGKVESMQTLHNLNEDELNGFEEAWKGNAIKYLPGWSGNSSGHAIGFNSSGQSTEAGRGGWALPSTEQVQRMENPVQDGRGKGQGCSSQEG